MNATDYLMFNVVFIGNNLSFVSSRFNMCNKFISIHFAINIEPVRPSTSTDFEMLAHCVFEFDTPGIKKGYIIIMSQHIRHHLVLIHFQHCPRFIHNH